MSMMSQIHESMTVTGDLARVERMSDEVAELDAIRMTSRHGQTT